MKLIDEDIYERSHILRTAFLDGQLAMTELLVSMITRRMVEKSLTRSGAKTDHEQGQIDAYSDTISCCEAMFSESDQKQESDTKYDA